MGVPHVAARRLGAIRAELDARRGRDAAAIVLTLGVGFVVLLAAEIALALGLPRFMSGASFEWELSLMQWMAEVPVSRSAVQWLDVWGNALVTWPLVFFAAGFAAWKQRPFRAIAFFPAYAATEVFTLLGWAVWSRPRPHLEGILDVSWHSFPSGHVIHVVYVVGLLCWLWADSTQRRSEKFAAVIFAVIAVVSVCLIRLRTSVHWPTDVIVGVVIGAAWLGLVVFAISRAETGRAAPSS